MLDLLLCMSNPSGVDVDLLNTLYAYIYVDYTYIRGRLETLSLC